MSKIWSPSSHASDLSSRKHDRGYPAARHKQHSLEVGCVGFIAKPVIADKLLETLARCLKLEWIYDTAKTEAPLPPPGGDLKIERLPEPIAQAL